LSKKISNLKVSISKIFASSPDCIEDKNSTEEDDEKHTLQILKHEFSKTIDRIKQIKILTIFKDWSYRKIQENFPSATFHMIFNAKQTAEKNGILSDPNPKSHPFY